MPSVHALVPLVACLVSALSGLAIVLRDPGHPGNRAAAWLMAAGSWWALCQVLWTLAPDAAGALCFHRLGALGWSCLGPLSLQLVAAVAPAPAWIRRALVPGYAVGAAFGLLHLTTPWLQANPVPAPWGWDFSSGPLHPWFFAFSMLFVLPALALGLRAVRSARSPAERRPTRIIALAVSVAFVLATLTSALLPMAGVATPRLGATSLAVLGVAVALSYYRYGYSPAAPGSFAREVLELLPDGVALLRQDGGLHYANGSMLAMLGLGPADLLSANVAARLGRPVLEDEHDLREVECELATSSGPVPVAISTSRLLDKRGLPLARVLVVRDLREVRNLRSRLITTGRLAAVGQLAAGIAHEINNPTAYVRSNLTQLREVWAELAKRAAAPSGDELAALFALGEELIEESLEGVERTATIVRDVRGFAHGGGGRIEPVDLNRLIGEVLRMAQPQLREGVLVESRLSDVPLVSGVSQELRQVLLNLVVNAVQAIEHTGTVVVKTLRERGRVVVQVQDDGRGIPPEDLDRVFDPFFTTKAVGEGTGLGLAISYQIVRAHEAELLVDSEVGRGSCFTLRFPATEPGPTAPA